MLLIWPTSALCRTISKARATSSTNKKLRMLLGAPKKQQQKLRMMRATVNCQNVRCDFSPSSAVDGHWSPTEQLVDELGDQLLRVLVRSVITAFELMSQAQIRP